MLVYPRVYTYPHILFWLLQCLYITVCVERHSVFVLLINMIARWVPTQTVLSSFPPFSVGKPLPFVQPERSESQVLHWTSACQSSKMVQSTTVFMRIPITEVSRCPNSHCPFKTPIKMPKFHIKKPLIITVYHLNFHEFPPLTRSRQTSCACSDPFAHQWGRMRPQFRHFWDVPAQQIMDIEHFQWNPRKCGAP